MAPETASVVLDESRATRWSTFRDFLYLETAIAALSSLRYLDESGTETLGGVLLFAGVFGYMGLTEGPCAATTPGILQLIPAALVLVGGYDVFMGSKRDPTARDVFWTNEAALNVILVSGLLMSRNTPSLTPPCR